MKVAAEFVTSAANAAGFPRDGLREIALVGRSNVGKSSLINALARRRISRTSAAPGKTRLANLYRVVRGTSPAVYLVDLPGYGYARGGEASVREFEALARAYFGRGQAGQAGEYSQAQQPDPLGAEIGALLVVDARHPGLVNDLEAWNWLKQTVAGSAIVANKIDKLARGQRSRAQRELESAFEESVLPVSAVTNEGLDELWKLIDGLTNSRNSKHRRKPNNNRLTKATAR